MRGNDHAIPLDALDVMQIARPEAAQLLRSARLAGPEGRDEAIDWAFAALPDSRHARRLKIEHLIDAGDAAAADALIAQGLLLRPSDPALTLLRASSLLVQNAPRQAEREIRLALEQRPRHVRTLLVGARIARALHDEPLAIERLEQALKGQPGRDDVRVLLIEILLDAGGHERAANIARDMTSPAPTLAARLLQAEGRTLEAIEHLEAARATRTDLNALTEALLDVLEDAGHYDRLRQVAIDVPADDPVALVRAGRSLLLVGEFERVVNMLAPIRESGPQHREALAMSVVALAMLGQASRGEELLVRLQQTPVGADPVVMAELWRRAFTARHLICRTAVGAVQPATDRSLLGPLAESALEVLDAETHRHTTSRRAEIERHRGLCLAVLGRNAEAAEAHARAGDLTHPPDPPLRLPQAA